MKKITILIACILILVFTVIAFAGEKKYNIEHKEFTFLNSDLELVSDTLFYGDTPTLWTATPGGYVAGPNGYGDLGKYQRFDFQGQNTLTGTVIYWAVKNIIGSADSIDVVVKTVGGNGAPDTTLFSERISVADIDTTNGFNYISFPGNIVHTGPLFIGFEWGAALDDEFACVCDADGEGEGQSRAWEKWSDGTYYSFDDASAWQLDVDLWIAAEYDNPVGISDFAGNQIRDYELLQNYPNPFNPITNIKYQIPNSGRVVLEIYNNLGQKIRTLVNREQNDGWHHVQWNGQDDLGNVLSSGVYIYKLTADRIVQSNKMLLLK